MPSVHPAGAALALLPRSSECSQLLPQAVPAEPIPHPACNQMLRAFPIPLLALLPSKRNRLHLARLPRRPRAAGVQPREWVCVEACGHIAAPATPPPGGGRDPRSESEGWGGMPSTQCWSQPGLGCLPSVWVTKGILASTHHLENGLTMALRRIL